MTRILWVAAWTAILGCGVAFIAGEHTLAQYTSSFNGTVRVTEDGAGIRRLRFSGDSSVQSAIDVDNPDYLVSAYARAAVDVLARCPAHSYRLLVLGLGGGVIPNAVRHRCPGVIVDAVDIDPMVVRAAMRWFHVGTDASFSVYVQDAVAFVHERAIDAGGDRYDAVLVDIFNGVNAPPSSELGPFVAGLQQVLTPDGVVVLNLLSARFNPQHDRVAALYAGVFGDTRVDAVAGSGNFLLVARNGRPVATIGP